MGRYRPGRIEENKTLKSYVPSIRSVRCWGPTPRPIKNFLVGKGYNRVGQRQEETKSTGRKVTCAMSQNTREISLSKLVRLAQKKRPGREGNWDQGTGRNFPDFHEIGVGNPGEN